MTSKSSYLEIDCCCSSFLWKLESVENTEEKMPKSRSKFQIKIEEIAVRVLIGAIGLLPYGCSLKIGKFLGKITLRCFPRLYKTAHRNLDIALLDISHKKKKEIIMGTFESLGRHLGFISQFHKLNENDVQKNVELIGKENFDRAHNTGRGVILFSGHFGGWEVLNFILPAFGHKTHILVRRLDNPLVEKYIDARRTKFGNVTLGKKDAPRKMYRLLKNGEALGMMADLNAQLHDGVFVDFFGVPASTTTSIAKLALKTDAIILPAFSVWEKEKGKYVVYIEPPIKYEKTGDGKKDVLSVTKKVTEKMEKLVRKYPEQWLWVHKRWNTRPKGEKSLYEDIDNKR